MSALALYETLRWDGVVVVRGGDGVLLHSPTVPWLCGYADALIYDGRAQVEGVLEVKTRAPPPQRQGGAAPAAVPHQRLQDLYYHIPQCAAYMEATAAAYCDLMSFTPRGSTVFRLRFDAPLFQRIVALAAAFVHCVSSGTAPLDEDGLNAERKLVRDLLLDYPWESLQDMPM